MCNPAYWDKSGSAPEQWLYRKLLVLGGESRSELQETISRKLRTAGFECIVVQPVGGKLTEDFDVIVVLQRDSSLQRLITQLQRRKGKTRGLVPGGVLIIHDPLQKGVGISLDERHWISLCSSNALTLYRKRAALCNETAAIYWRKSTEQIRDEREKIQRCCVSLTVQERDRQLLSQAHRTQINDTLKREGVCIVTSLYREDAELHATADVLRQDMQRTLALLQEHFDVDLLFPKHDSDTVLENFYELSLREHRRCDLRHTPQLSHLCPAPTSRRAAAVSSSERWQWPQISVTHVERALTLQQQQQQAQSPLKHLTQPTTASETGSSNKAKSNQKIEDEPFFTVQIPDPSAISSSSLLHRLRMHAGLVSAIHETLCPSHPDAAGNWGRYNFEGPGPEAPHPIAVGQPGCVFSFPGCLDQTVHADTAHLLDVSPSLPPHYVNLFLPLPTPAASFRSALSDEEDEEDEDIFDAEVEDLRGCRVGQTAFVAGSHELAVSCAIMAKDDLTQLLARLVRPQYFAGDALLFDCRTLHFGLANQLPAPTTSSSAADQTEAAEGQRERWLRSVLHEQERWRPIVYVNYTRDWFQDPKNWNDRRRIFSAEERAMVDK